MPIDVVCGVVGRGLLPGTQRSLTGRFTPDRRPTSSADATHAQARADAAIPLMPATRP
jgi:hypothetical protein